MSQMINELYKFITNSGTVNNYDMDDNYLSTTEYVFKDYTYKKYFEIGLWDEVNDSNWVSLYQLDDNEKIETVSYNVYDTTKYWDLLLCINKRDPLFDLCYDYDTLVDIVDRYYDEYNSKYDTVISDIHRDKLKAEFLSERLEQNEKNRVLKIIKPEKIQDFLRLLVDRGYIVQDS